MNEDYKMAGKKKYVLREFWKFMLVMALTVVAVIVFIRCGRTREESESVTTEPSSQIESISETTLAPDKKEEENLLLQDTMPEIQELMKQFYQAKFDCDMDTLRQLVNPFDGFTEDGLYEERYGKDESGLFEIERYQVESCYTKRGLEDESYFVWVYVDIKYANAETHAPAVFRMYVCMGENGYYIYNDSLDEEIRAYRDKISKEEDVLKLVDMVNERFKDAVNRDEQLKNIVLSMEGTNGGEIQSQEESSLIE